MLEIFEFLTSGKPWSGRSPQRLLRSSGTNAVGVELQSLQYSAEVLVQKVQQQAMLLGQQRQQQERALPVVRTPVRDLSWSEVTHGAVRKKVHQLQEQQAPQQQDLQGQGNQQQQQHQLQQQRQESQQQGQQAGAGASPGAGKGMSWSEVTHGGIRGQG